MSDGPGAKALPGASAREVFGRRAAYYVSSAAHTDALVLARIVELCALQPGEIALDVGTGTGHTAFALAPYAAQVIGLDPTPQMLAEAEVLRRQQGLCNVHWVLGDVAALPLRDQAVDVVTCRRAAHHFPDILAAMKEMRRMLRPGGRLVIDDRTVPDEPDLDALMNRLDVLHDPSHVREYRQDEWVALCEAVGLVPDIAEVYVRHRPLSSLTEGAGADEAAEILQLVEAMSPAQGAALDLERRPDGYWFDHLYLMLRARCPGP